MWIGLTIWKAPLAGVALTVVGIAVMDVPGWAVMLGMGGILAALLIWIPEPLLLCIWLGVLLLLVWTHRTDLVKKPGLRSWIRNGLSPWKKS